MVRHYRSIMASAALAACVAAVVTVAAIAGRSENPATGARALPTACDNLVAAAEAVANPTPSAGADATAADPLSADPAAGQYDTFRTLLEACGQERAAARG